MECEKCRGSGFEVNEKGMLIACECTQNYFKHGIDLNDIECDMCEGEGFISMDDSMEGYGFHAFACDCIKVN